MDVERELTAGIDRSRLVQLKFTTDQAGKALNWNDGREFEYRGHMYDVVQTTFHGDSVFYICYQDHKETRLNQEKERLIAKATGQDPSRKSQTEKLTNFLNDVFSHDIFSWNSFFLQPKMIHYSLFTVHYSLFTRAPLSPPPKCL
jgi:hypothetical protein